MRTKKTVSMKAVVLLMAVVLLIGCTIGGSLAWLMTESKAVINTFVVGDIGTLTLTENGAEASDDTRTFTIIPGKAITKDVTVSYSYTDSTTDDYEAVPVYIFVKIDTTGWNISDDGMSYTIMQDGVTDPLLSWSIESGWKQLDGVAGVYYYELNDTTGYSMTQDVITNNGTITVSSAITEGMIGNVSASASDITFKAYAIQKDGHTDVNDAWSALNN